MRNCRSSALTKKLLAVLFGVLAFASTSASAATVAIVDTMTLVDATGDVNNWTASTGTRATCVDERPASTNDADYVETALNNKSQFFITDFRWIRDVRNNIQLQFDYIDSVKIAARYKQGSDIGGSKDSLKFWYDTSGTDKWVETKLLSPNNTWVNYLSPSITSVTHWNTKGMEIGFSSYYSGLNEASIYVSAISLIVYGRDDDGIYMLSDTTNISFGQISSGANNDQWFSATGLVASGNISSEKFRSLIGTNDDTAFAYSNGGAHVLDSAYLYMYCLAKTGSPDTAILYMIKPRVRGTPDTTFGILRSNGNVTSYYHATWSARFSTASPAGDTMLWNTAGVDGKDIDYDTIRVATIGVPPAAGTYLKINIAPWLDSLVQWNSTGRTFPNYWNRSTGLLLRSATEAGSGTNYWTVFTPFAASTAAAFKGDEYNRQMYLAIYAPLVTEPLYDNPISACYFGDTVSRGSSLTIENQIVGHPYTATTTGKASYVDAYIAFGGSGTKTTRCAIYSVAATPALLDTTVSWDTVAGAFTKWHRFSLPTPTTTYTSGTRYVVCVWALNVSGTENARVASGAPVGDTIYYGTQTFAGSAWPATKAFTKLALYKQSIYAEQVCPSGITGRRRKMLIGSLVREAETCFAGGIDETISP